MGHMDRETKLRLLRKSSLFAALPITGQNEILTQAAERSFRKGQAIFQKGDVGSFMMVVVRGRVRISDTSPAGREIFLNLIDAGEVFGEIALVDEKPRSADATAAEDTLLMVVERRHFVPWLQSSHELALRLIDILCERLRNTTEALGNRTMLNVPERLANKLLSLGAAYGQTENGAVRLDVPRTYGELSHFIDCSRETVNKQMSAWAKQGIVTREGRRIVLLKPQALKRISGQA